VGGGVNDPGWWIWIGGVEYTLPGDEHGTTWSTPWDWQVVADSPDRKTVRLDVRELGTGLIETINISLYPGRSYYEAIVALCPTGRWHGVAELFTVSEASAESNVLRTWEIDASPTSPFYQIAELEEVHLEELIQLRLRLSTDRSHWLTLAPEISGSRQ
jgi:hypothetical protein